MKRIALVGGSGLLGTWIAREFGDRYELVVIDRRPPPTDVADRIADYRQFDVLGPGLSDLLAGLEAVVLLAARRAGRDRTRETFRDYLPNLEIASRTLEACRHADIRNVVSLSSIAVYGRVDPRPWREDGSTSPETCYGLAKLAVEQLAHLCNRRYGMAVKSLRVAQVVGPDEREGFMLMTFIKRSLRGEPLEVYGSGRGRREYVYVRDVAGAVMAALAGDVPPRVYNIGTGVSTSHRELAEAVCAALGNAAGVTMNPDEPEDRSEHLLDVARAAESLRWRARWTLESALADMAPGLRAGSR